MINHNILEKKRVFNVLPRGMRYSHDGATSIDLCVSELTSASRFGQTTEIFGEAGDEPLPGGTFVRFDAGLSSRARMAEVVRAIRGRKPDIIMIQQHVPSAARVAKAVTDVPVVLHLHNTPKQPAAFLPILAVIKRAQRLRVYRRLGGLIFVSAFVRSRFEAIFPEVSTPRVVIPNGFDPQAFPASSERKLEILCIGRAAPEKGIVEAARGVAAALHTRPHWQATFLLSQPAVHPAYTAAVERELAPFGPRATVLYDVRHDVVREACCRAAIALVPSIWPEPFGRTAVESHAGGAALISSGTGGLKEVSGSAAVFLPEVSPATIESALCTLMNDAPRRQDLAHAGRQRVLSLFRIDVVAAKFDDFVAQRARQM